MKNTTSKKIAPFLLAGLLIGLFLTLQLRSEVVQTSSFPLDEYDLQMELVQIFQDEQSELESQLNELSGEVEASQDNTARLYSGIDDTYLNDLKKTLGLTEVSGQGVVIQLNDAESVDRENLEINASAMVRASDLRDLVNILRAFPYEGIAINDQRIVVSSPISSAGNSILVNNFQLLPPFEVLIITEIPDLVIQTLTNEDQLSSIYDRVKNSGLEFKFKKQEELTLPAYIGGYSTNYLNFVNE
ncbi:DUF881 domain-containing protein [Candidatus Peregrinibacteria bacterium]|nr:DUF881 domain-containing protein [Candidatus Peregrinibacteria bacterium]MBT7483969.1 DUF881 domain-containing protein [Candidatus Peregrinibacteria bacterium]MBT7703319.1 DUF881 domain-containing protein [Candidatus Peregrinibacteria bacterium]